MGCLWDLLDRNFISIAKFSSARTGQQCSIFTGIIPVWCPNLILLGVVWYGGIEKWYGNQLDCLDAARGQTPTVAGVMGVAGAHVRCETSTPVPPVTAITAKRVTHPFSLSPFLPHPSPYLSLPPPLNHHHVAHWLIRHDGSPRAWTVALHG